ncbi:MAG: hypothetical protein ACC645_15000 [Pirellulales bacterium]
MRNGKLVIFAIVGLALLAAAFSWSFRRHAMRRTMAFWGTEAALLIAHSHQVEALRLNESDSTAAPTDREVISFDDRRLSVIERHDVSHARGLTHLRQALLDDASFDFLVGQPADRPKWEYAIRFISGDRVATVLVSLADERLAAVDREGTLSMAPIAAGMAIILSGGWHCWLVQQREVER